MTPQRVLATILSYLATLPLAMAIAPETLEGTWIGISPQTVQVTALNADGSFSGTYFTPGADIRARVAGKWELKGDVFTMNYLEADSPPFRVPLKDENRLEVVSPETLILHTLPKGSSVEWKKVQFAAHESALKTKKAPVQSPSIESLQKLTEDDLINPNPLSAWMTHLVDSSKKPLYDDQIVDALQTTIPKKAGYYFAIFQLEGLWGNGGMQHVVLRDEIEQTQYVLKLAADGYDHFGTPKTAALIREIAAKAIPWMKEINALNKADAPEDKYKPIWSAIDAYDAVFDEVSAKEGGAYNALLKDIHEHPEDYTISPK